MTVITAPSGWEYIPGGGGWWTACLHIPNEDSATLDCPLGQGDHTLYRTAVTLDALLALTALVVVTDPRTY